MYLAAESDERRTAWMQAFRKGIIITPGVSSTYILFYMHKVDSIASADHELHMHTCIVSACLL